MNYLKILNLDREPFPNTPDPDSFYQSRQHLGCLQRLELSIRLKRGLNAVLGEVGTGKTTLCRQLIRRFSGEEGFETHLILDPGFAGPAEFLAAVAALFNEDRVLAGLSDLDIKESIKHYLFRRGVEEGRTVVLIIDEGQKLPGFALEILREFLNFETNDFKLLQIVIFAQKEFQDALAAHANFADRINLFDRLEPLDFHETRAMIRHRLELASQTARTLNLFTLPAVAVIYRASGGYPRKIINICHQCLLSLIIKDRTRVDYFLARACARRLADVQAPPPLWSWRTTVLAALLAVVLVVALGPSPDPAAWFGLDPAPVKATASVAAEPRAVSRPVALPSPEAMPLVGDRLAGTVRIEPAVDAPPAPPAASRPAPTSLGLVTVQHGESLSGLIRTIYGRFNDFYLAAVMAANPVLTDPNLLPAGSTIVFPALPVELSAWPEGNWITAADTDSLSAALRLVRLHRQNVPELRVVPHFDENDGLRFAVVLAKIFPDPASARAALDFLPPSLAGPATVLTAWKDKTVLYADPFTRGGQVQNWAGRLN